MIRKEEIVIETTLKTRTVTMVTVSEVKGNYHIRDGFVGFVCWKRPLALALVTPRGIRAFSTDGTEMEIPKFMERFPDTKLLLQERAKRRKQK
jgi:hypothetical protein